MNNNKGHFLALKTKTCMKCFVFFVFLKNKTMGVPDISYMKINTKDDAIMSASSDVNLFVKIKGIKLKRKK